MSLAASGAVADARSRPARRRRPVLLRHHDLAIATTRPLEVVDLTEAIERAVAATGLWNGVVSIQTRHTTTGLLVNEHEPRLLEDLVGLFDRLVPSDAPYAHDDFARRAGPLPLGERRNGHAHCRAALLRASEQLHVRQGAVDLGRWQRVLFVDFDGGQRRQVSVLLQGVSGPSRSRARIAVASRAPEGLA